MHIDYARRRARGGKGLIPPNKTQWDNEHHALDVRDGLKLDVADPLPAIQDVYQPLLPTVSIIPHGEVPAAAIFLDHLRRTGRSSWSGLSLPMGNGLVWVIYNDAHRDTRVRATLMEEFFHLYLGHPPSHIRVMTSGDGVNRSYNPDVEHEAYGCAAAALVPYAGLRQMVLGGLMVSRIAAHYRVSPQLVLFRLKVTRLYSKMRRWRRR
jgi:hypothetical protein